MAHHFLSCVNTLPCVTRTTAQDYVEWRHWRQRPQWRIQDFMLGGCFPFPFSSPSFLPLPFSSPFPLPLPSSLSLSFPPPFLLFPPLPTPSFFYYPFPSSSLPLLKFDGERLSSPSGVRGRAPAANVFMRYFEARNRNWRHQFWFIFFYKKSKIWQ